jgi:iron complex transport system permease protein
MNRSVRIILILAALTPFVLAYAVTIGTVDIGLMDVIRVLRDRITGVPSADASMSLIVLELRLPRVFAAWLVGAGLACVGIAMQALVRNPLAEPYILGVSGGASAGASLFYMGVFPAFITGVASISMAAFVGALVTMAIVYGVARSSDGLSITRLLLAGVAMAALTASLSSFVTFAYPDANRLRAGLWWLLGSLSGITVGDLPLAATVTTGGVIVLFLLSRSLDALLLGEEPAQGLGVSVERVKQVLVVLAALVTGTLVAISGAIGFVGLIVPHAVRSFTGVSHRYVIPAGFLAGGLFLVLADILSMVLLPNQQLPVGIVTALAGVPFFLLLLRRGSYRFHT